MYIENGQVSVYLCAMAINRVSVIPPGTYSLQASLVYQSTGQSIAAGSAVTVTVLASSPSARHSVYNDTDFAAQAL